MDEELKETAERVKTNLVSVIKNVTVQMIRMSDIGYDIEDEIIIKSSWGQQTKPAGQESYLICAES